jgi:hypothetical protein
MLWQSPPGGHYILDTEASDVLAEVVLSQFQDGIEKVTTYWSKGVMKSQKNYSITCR